VNAKTCKRIRAAARLMTTGRPYRVYDEKRNAYGALLRPITLGKCTRATYRYLKKITRRGQIPVPAKP
jgi:hypothetical protein